MEVVVAAAAAEFHFDSTSTTPYVSAPSSPRSFGDWSGGGHYYTSAPTSPTRAAAIFREFNVAMAGGLASSRPSSRASVIPFDWEDAPGTPKSAPPEWGHGQREEEAETERGDDEDGVDFAFEFSGQLEMGGSSPLTADELFEKGMIRPLKPPPRLQYVPPAGENNPAAASPRSPKSPKSPRSPRSRLFRPWGRQQDDFDPFAKAIEETTRGRDRATPQSTADGSSRGSRRAARSVSPLRRVFDFGNNKPASAATGAATTSAATGAATAAATGNAVPSSSGVAARWIKGGSKKWRLRDLLLFRSASEGRATGGGDRDPLRKYTALSPSSAAMLSRKSSTASLVVGQEDSRNASFRSSEGGSVGGSSRRGASAHERHYAANRAAAEEMRKKTTLPYRQGLFFGCLGLHNPAIQGVARGFSSFSRTR